MRKQIAYIVAFLLTVFSFPLSAQEKADGEGEKAFDPKETIFEHLLDGYGWELPFSHEHKIPLPVIVRDYKGDWKIFVSLSTFSRFFCHFSVSLSFRYLSSFSIRLCFCAIACGMQATRLKLKIIDNNILFFIALGVRLK